ncbi:MAG: YwbE family protein [Saprospiraceae bacterium]
MENESLDGRKRKNINIGDVVEIVQKQHQRTGALTEGIVKRILTKATNHPHGIKVMLQLGEVGRVKNILEE